MTNKTESGYDPTNPDEKHSGLLTGVNAEFGLFTERSCKGLEEEQDEMIAEGFLREEDKVETIDRRKKEYKSLDFVEKISKMTNNFYCWWSNGSHRELLAQSKTKKDADLEKISLEEKLINDLDEIIKKEGYTNLKTLIQTKNTQGDEAIKRATAIANVFFGLIDRGYDFEKLRR